MNDMLVNGLAETRKLNVPGVEVRLTPATVAVRDSKSPGTGQVQFAHTAWAAFVERAAVWINAF